MDNYRIAFCDGVLETKDDICQIIFEGEDTEIGRVVTIQRIKDKINYNRWLSTKEN